jgi:hypothetical protein
MVATLQTFFVEIRLEVGYMNITIDLPDNIYDALRNRSVETGNSIDSVIGLVLSDYLLRMNRSNQDSDFMLPTMKLGGLLPGVNLDNSAELLDILNADENKAGFNGPYH